MYEFYIGADLGCLAVVVVVVVVVVLQLID